MDGSLERMADSGMKGMDGWMDGRVEDRRIKIEG